MIFVRLLCGAAALKLSACMAAPAPDMLASPPETGAKPGLAASLVIDRPPQDFPDGGDARSAAEINLIVVHSIGGSTCRGWAVFLRPRMAAPYSGVTGSSAKAERAFTV